VPVSPPAGVAPAVFVAAFAPGRRDAHVGVVRKETDGGRSRSAGVARCRGSAPALNRRGRCRAQRGRRGAAQAWVSWPLQPRSGASRRADVRTRDGGRRALGCRRERISRPAPFDYSALAVAGDGGGGAGTNSSMRASTPAWPDRLPLKRPRRGSALLPKAHRHARIARYAPLARQTYLDACGRANVSPGEFAQLRSICNDVSLVAYVSPDPAIRLRDSADHLPTVTAFPSWSPKDASPRAML